MRYGGFVVQKTSPSGPRIRELREQRGMSAAALADAVGVSTRAIHYIEGGTHDPRLGVAQRIAEALGVTVNELVDEAA